MSKVSASPISDHRAYCTGAVVGRNRTEEEYLGVGTKRSFVARTARDSVRSVHDIRRKEQSKFDWTELSPSAHDHRLDVDSEAKELETLEGFVEGIEDGTAYLRLTGEDGDILYGHCSQEELEANGIRERRRFKCIVRELRGAISIDLVSVPDNKISDERLHEIREEVRRIVGGDTSDHGC